MKRFSGYSVAVAVIAATMLMGCPPVVVLHSQNFEAGENDLGGKQLYFIPTPGDNAYQRMVTVLEEGATYGNDPTGDPVAAFGTSGFHEVFLGLGNAIPFYGRLYSAIYIGADGTIGMGVPGDNSSVVAHFSQPQVSLVVVDDGTSTGTVSYDVVSGDSVAVTFDGVTAGGATAMAQAEFFIADTIQAKQVVNGFGDIALTYLELSANASGVYGLSNGQLAGASQGEIDSFLQGFANQAALSTEVMTGTL